MANDPRITSLEKQFEELSERVEEIQRQSNQRFENRSAEISSLRESLSGAISAADRDAAAVEVLASRIGSAEDRLNKPPEPVNWVAIGSLVLASALAVSGLGRWALTQVESEQTKISVELRRAHDRIETLQMDQARSQMLDSRNTQEILKTEEELHKVVENVLTNQERTRALENRVDSIDKIGPRISK